MRHGGDDGSEGLSRRCDLVQAMRHSKKLSRSSQNGLEFAAERSRASLFSQTHTGTPCNWMRYDSALISNDDVTLTSVTSFVSGTVAGMAAGTGSSPSRAAVLLVSNQRAGTR